MGTPERLADVDRELASFGKSDELLGAVIQRARDGAPSALDAIDAVLDGLSERSRSEPAPAEATAPVAEPPRARPPTPPPPARPLTAKPPPRPPAPARAPSSFPRPASIPAAPRVETVPPPGMVAKPATWERPAPIEPPPEDGSGLVELPDEILRGAALPPVLELDVEDPPAARRPIEPPVEEEPTDASPAIAARVAAIRAAAAQARDIPPAPARAPSVRPPRPPSEAPVPDTTPPGAPAVEAFEDTTDVRDPNSLENALLTSDEVIGEEPTGEVVLPPPATRDDRPLANLFDDAAPASVAPGPLADLFDDPRPEAEPAAHQDLADLLGADLQEALAAGGHGADGSRPLDDDGDATALFGDPLAPRSSLPPRPPGDVLDAQLDSIVGDSLSNAVEPSDMPPSGEFELMIDEDVLVLDDLELGEGESSVGSSDDGEGRIPRSQIPPPLPSSQPPPPPPGTQPKGLISRLLNRK
ncbi:hypothetical protein [Sandaracinus amylolyticus]|uniref:hypothetical protein n=1 Tax=Sandaracinus amylolyticus TaxID=927083 RepID=UPI001F34A182|nr:hypothetical protein [Sandaracinus amylolyticus]UJR79554.1 Basic proline-rich protein [Sandaracinus amylolyticus]